MNEIFDLTKFDEITLNEVVLIIVAFVIRYIEKRKLKSIKKQKKWQ